MILTSFFAGVRQYFKSLFSGSTFFLFFAICFLYLFVDQIMAIRYDSKKLVKHIGVVERKYIEKEKRPGDTEGRSDSIDVLRIKFFGSIDIYSATGKIRYYDYAINVGDTLKLYTKPITSLFGNHVTDAGGSLTTHDPNHIYHLVTQKDNDVVIDFERHKEELKNTAALFGALGIIMFIIYLFSRGKEYDLDGDEQVFQKL